MYRIVTRLRNQVILLALLIIVAILLGRYWSELQGSTLGTDSKGRTFEFGARLDPVGAITADVSSEYLTINVNPKGGEALSATGWRLVGVEHEATIGNATALPTQGAVNVEEPLVITKATKLIVNTGHSPIGVSFRENKCSGLLSFFQTFEPQLDKACEDCREETRSTTLGASYPDYNACVEAHKGDSDFFSNTWRIYLGKDTELWRKDFEIIKLINREGRTLDSASY